MCGGGGQTSKGSPGMKLTWAKRGTLLRHLTFHVLKWPWLLSTCPSSWALVLGMALQPHQALDLIFVTNSPPALRPVHSAS